MQTPRSARGSQIYRSRKEVLLMDLLVLLLILILLLRKRRTKLHIDIDV